MHVWKVGCSELPYHPPKITHDVFAVRWWIVNAKRCWMQYLVCVIPSVLWHCQLGDQKGIWPVKTWMLVCWWWRFDWSFACLIAPVVTIISRVRVEEDRCHCVIASEYKCMFDVESGRVPEVVAVVPRLSFLHAEYSSACLCNHGWSHLLVSASH